MKQYRLAFGLLTLSALLVFFSCKRINEGTELGSDLIPPVDNINTFDTVLDVASNLARLNDTSRFLYTDQGALGATNDPLFGQTKADLYFNISATTYGYYPFLVRPQDAGNTDSLQIDSVVLALAYTGNYGDTNSQHSVEVYEIAQNAGFNDTTLHEFNRADFATTGSNLVVPVPGITNGTFRINQLNDTMRFIGKRDTTKFVNQLHIQLNPSLGRRLAQFDTSSTNLTQAGFRTDSIFKTLFRGLAIKTTSSANPGGLAYFALNDPNTRLTVYFRTNKSGIRDTSSVTFNHATNGQANIIRRTPGGAYQSTLANANPNDPQLYLQSTPGSYAALKILGLENLSNRVVHRAELIVPRLSDPSDNTFGPPSRLLLDRRNATGVTSFVLDRDLPVSPSGTISFSVFGGSLGTDQTYRFNITRHVQGVITRREPNDSLRMYAALRSILYVPSLGGRISVPGISRVAEGRVVVAGGSFASPADNRLRVRIIYSKL